MEIKTNRSREVQSERVVPPPDTARRRKKAIKNPGNSHRASRHFIAAIKTLGKLCAFLLTVLLMLSIFICAYTSDKLNLRDIKFYGCKELDPKQLEEIVRREFPANILRIDLHQLKKRLEEETWMRQVEIRRVLPSLLAIYVQERTPSVIIEMHGEMMVADRDGRMLDRLDTAKFGKMDVPVLRGVMGEDLEGYRLNQDENSARIRNALKMLSEIESGPPQDARDAKKISEVDISDLNNLKIMLVNDTAEVSLGSKDYLNRFHNLMGYYPELKSKNHDIASIDLRFEGQIVYRPKPQANQSKGKS
jgi:cell division septal protein FtsQ